MTRKDLETIKQRLQTERTSVEESLRRNKRSALSEGDGTTQDSGDLAVASHDKSVLYQLQESDFRRLRLINEVLARIEDDGYGTCEECGEEIGRARLEAIPWAHLCLTCQAEVDMAETLSNVAFPERPVSGNEYGAA